MTFKIKMGIASVLLGSISVSSPALQIVALLSRQIKAEAWNHTDWLINGYYEVNFNLKAFPLWRFFKNLFSFWNSSQNQLFLNIHSILCFENRIAMKSLFRHKIIAKSQAKGTHLPDFKMIGIILEKFNLQRPLSYWKE